ncbi:oxidoreductase [Xanthomonas floridensis]|uniref:Oxidoreductase n=1 Tax=Xanthomonas floridensis TaxID=1843580 RepID=A0A1A9MAE7_9XANT|nr:oxidoreductase [Xanthomonas floridensis]MEA5125506.1 oxidoreductase [Xanthomonas floridensis]MEA5133315.1 oxidoreductase [Xanthomonas floridensis]OAG67039.1 short-chain dehydrogenase/reductase [Xanthomonas floridensis]
MTSHPPVALVTGASSGIGLAAATQLAAAGYTVYGTSRRGADAGERGFPLLALDVTDDASVQSAIDALHAREGRIDLLVNNAGIGITGAAEESSIAQVRALFDTNVYGVVRVTNAVLPIMRAQRSGRILNVGSGLGFIPAPFSAYYSASKHALEGYSESLDHEVRGFGIRVTVIEPGATRTGFESSTTPADRPLSAYDALRAGYQKAYDAAMAVADTPDSVAQTIVLAAGDQRPKLRYPSGKSARQGAFARRFLPRAMLDKALHKQFGMGS